MVLEASVMFWNLNWFANINVMQVINASHKCHALIWVCKHQRHENYIFTTTQPFFRFGKQLITIWAISAISYFYRPTPLTVPPQSPFQAPQNKCCRCWCSLRHGVAIRAVLSIWQLMNLSISDYEVILWLRCYVGMCLGWYVGMWLEWFVVNTNLYAGMWLGQ